MMTASDRDLIVAGLRSGAYRKITGRPYDGDGGLCANGVAADMLGYDWSTLPDTQIGRFIPMYALLRKRGVPSMSKRNDFGTVDRPGPWSFDEIADWLQTLAVDDGSTVRWTVEPLPVSQLSAEAAGQLALFGAW